MKVLIIDNYDSFIYNLKYELELQGAEVSVCRNDVEYSNLLELVHDNDAIVLSPGPGTPKNAGHCIRLIKDNYRLKPMLGICLGHQAMVEAFNGTVGKAKSVMHGKTSSVNIIAKGLFTNLSSPLTLARYHSLSATDVSGDFEVIALSFDDEVMAISHKNYPVHGLQFHPESIMSFQGSEIIKNFMQQVYFNKHSINNSGSQQEDCYVS